MGDAKRDPNHIKCIDCRFWEAGKCRRNPPQVLWPTVCMPQTMWPDVRNDDWCGSWAPADMLTCRERAAAQKTKASPDV